MEAIKWIAELLAAAAVGLLLGRAATAAEPPGNTAAVTLTAERPELVAGAPVRVLLASEATRSYTLVSEATFDDAGACTLQLAPGLYRFAVLHDSAGRRVALRSKLAPVRASRKVELDGAEATGTEVTLDGQPVRVLAFALRHLTPTGEFSLTTPGEEVAPSFAVSPAERYRYRLFGQVGETYIAVWDDALGRDLSRIQLRGHSLLSCTFPPPSAESGAVPTRSATIYFPESELPIGELSPDTRFLTNRRFIEVAYAATTASSKRLVFHPRPYVLGREQKLSLSGTVRPVAWVTTIPRFVGDPERAEWLLQSGVSLLDEDAHELDVTASQVSLTHALQKADGSPAPTDAIPDEVNRNLGDLSRPLRVAATYDIGPGETRITLVPQTFQRYESARFDIQGPPAWKARLRLYLAKAERAYDIISTQSPFPGPRPVNIHWHLGTHNAKGGWHGHLHGNKEGWIRQPFRTLEESRRCFSRPMLIVHEIQHSFGYGHGEEMDAHQKLYEALFDAYPWTAADQPAYLPPGLR